MTAGVLMLESHETGIAQPSTQRQRTIDMLGRSLPEDQPIAPPALDTPGTKSSEALAALRDHRRRARVEPAGRSAVAINPTIWLTLWVATWCLVLAGVAVLTLRAVEATTGEPASTTAPGRTTRINQPGMPDWPIPVDRAAFDEYYQGTRDSDDEAIEHAFTAFEWIKVSHRQAVRIVDVDGEAVQVELLEGPNVGRRGWLKPRHLAP